MSMLYSWCWSSPENDGRETMLKKSNMNNITRVLKGDILNQECKVVVKNKSQVFI